VKIDDIVFGGFVAMDSSKVREVRRCSAPSASSNDRIANPYPSGFHALTYFHSTA
jgi:hypothetical protein